MVKRDENGRLLPGSVLNPEGKKQGTVGFATKWRKFIDKVAKDNNIDFDATEQELMKVAYSKAKEGDYQFYRDIFDRVYGKPQQSIDHTTEGKEMPTPILYVSNDNSDKEGDADDQKDQSITRGDGSEQDDISTPLLDKLGSE